MATEILNIVSSFLPLKKFGKNYRGFCPFHLEKTPSFMINEEKQIFHCFGCGEGGDVFTFIMKLKNFSFLQSKEYLDMWFGVKYYNLPIKTKEVNEFDKDKYIKCKFCNCHYRKTKNGTYEYILLNRHALNNHENEFRNNRKDSNWWR